MFGNNEMVIKGLDTRETFNKVSPEMAGAIVVVHRRQAIIDKALLNTRRAIGVVSPPSQDVVQPALDSFSASDITTPAQAIAMTKFDSHITLINQIADSRYKNLSGTS